MALGNDTRSRVMAWLKIALPLAALGLLSVLFLLSRPAAPPTTPEWLERRGETAGDGERVSGPAFAAMTEDGTDLMLTARSARPAPEASGRAIAEALRATARLPGGSEIRLNARSAVLDEAASEAQLSGGVELSSSTGYALETERLSLGFDRLRMESAGPVTGRAPAGRVTAGRLLVEGATQDRGARLLFTEGVKLLYDPRGQ